MSDDPIPFPEVDRVVHEPARLAIMTVLSSCRSADFLFLQSVTGLSKGNLSVQISHLEEAGLVTVEKSIVNKKTLTRISLTGQGTEVMERYWKTMDQIRKQSRFKVKR
jgi:DNA-binding transcriptional ArsR family regulator